MKGDISQPTAKVEKHVPPLPRAAGGIFTASFKIFDISLTIKNFTLDNEWSNSVIHVAKHNC